MTDHADTIRRLRQKVLSHEREALNAYEAELRQAQEERDRAITQYAVELKKVRDQRREAIDALREIDEVMIGSSTDPLLLHKACEMRDRARAALVKLGEQS